MNVIKLMEYSRLLRHNYLDAFSKLPWEEFVKDRGASFDSLRNIFLHCVDVLDYFANHLFQGDAERKRVNFDEYNNFEKIKDYVERVEAGAGVYLSKITPEELSRKVERKFTDGTVVNLTIEDWFVHIFQEETHHRGEFIAILWSMDIEPPHLGWARFVSR